MQMADTHLVLAEQRENPQSRPVCQGLEDDFQLIDRALALRHR
jgi:hypothetical protein